MLPKGMIKGIIIGGEFGKILAREKADSGFSLGELVVCETGERRILMRVVDLSYGSQISPQNLELISGMKLEEDPDITFTDPALRNYTLATLKNLITISRNYAHSSKSLPGFFSYVRAVIKEDLEFITVPENPLFLGHLRSGKDVLDVPIVLDGKKVFSHHVLISATTGKGKSNLTSVLLWESLDKEYCGILVLDPHDEYYGRNSFGLKDHHCKDKVSYYTPTNPPHGAKTLKIHVSCLKPSHFNGVTSWSGAQKEALSAYYRKYRKDWIEAILLESPLQNFHEGTLHVVKRRLAGILNASVVEGRVYYKGVFDNTCGESTVGSIAREIEEAKTVIIDTSNCSGALEILIGSLMVQKIFSRYKQHKIAGNLESKPVVSIIIEEAPRVLGKDVLEKGSNIFSTIAREGRKFKVGLTAITQLPSLIPRDILANINTKIILGVEMKPERQALIESSAQDLSDDDRNIASLDKGEAIITSNFSRFATPISIPLFSELEGKKEEHKITFSGMRGD